MKTRVTIKDFQLITKRIEELMSIIVPTSELAQDYLADLEHSSILRPDVDKLFTHLLSCIAYKDIALWQLEQNKQRYLDVVQSLDPTYGVQASRSFYNVGVRLFNLMNQMDAYKANYLIFIKDRWVGSNLILTRLTPDEIPDII